jgi:hypothetical protein
MDDWHAYVRACAPRLSAGASPSRQLVRLALFIVLGLAFSAAAHSVDVPVHLPSFLAGCLLLVASVWFNARAVKRMAIPDVQGQFLVPLVVDFEPAGLRIRRDGSDSFTSWPRIQSTTLTSEHLFMWVDRSNAHILPLRDLPRDVQAEQLKGWLDARIGNAVTPLGDDGLRSLPSARPQQQSADAVRPGWPTALVRLLCLRPAGLPNQTNGAVNATLGVFALGTWVVLDWFANQPDPQLQLYGVASIGWYALLMLAIAAVLARTATPAADFGSVLTLTLAVAPLAIALRWLLDAFTNDFVQLAGVLVLLGYLIAYSALGLRLLTGASQANAMTRALLVAVLFGASAEALYIEPSVWFSESNTESAAATNDLQIRQRAEAVWYEQPAKIDAAIAAMAPSSGSAPTAYFLGFAGMGEQRVFAEEIKLAATVAGNRFGSSQRSVLLINDARDLDTLPLANPTALRRALQGVAATMNVDRDVLVLSLSSHGSQDATIAVSNGPLLMNDLSASNLAAALQASGIKWRVIVVSACYSGSFIEPLKNAYTAVITASAADRTSFGCSDDRDLTYFGEAFYRDALPKADSLRAAYEAARAAIRKREMDEGITASRPQAYFGSHIEAHLRRLQGQAPRR